MHSTTNTLGGAERRPRRLSFAGSGGSLSTLVDDEEAAPLVTETDSPGDGGEGP